MKRNILFGIFFMSIKSSSQDSLKILYIDSLVSANEIKVSTVYQKIERNKLETMHGKNPDKILTMYRFDDKDILIASTYIAYSIGDTDMIINFYFNADELIKAKTISFDMNNNRREYNYYYNNNELINKDAEMSGIHGGSSYIKKSARIRKNLKKRPIKFPL